MLFEIYFLILSIVSGLKISLKPCNVNPELLPYDVTEIQYRAILGFRLCNVENLYNEEDNTIDWKETNCNFHIFYVKKGEKVFVSELFYGRKPITFNDKNFLKLYEKIRKIICDFGDDLKLIKSFKKLKKEEVWSREDEQHFFITEMMEKCKLQSHEDHILIFVVREFIFLLYEAIYEPETVGMTTIEKENYRLKKYKNLNTRWCPFDMKQVFKQSENIFDIVSESKRLLPDDLFITEEFLKLTELLLIN